MDTPPKNYMLRMWLLLFALICILTGMFYLPEQIAGWEIKPIDILSQIRKQPLTDSTSIDSQEIIPEQPLISDQTKDSIRRAIIAEKGLKQDSTLVSIEDPTADHSALSHFFAALSKRNELGRPVRIAVLGDSFIEGDIFTAPLRSKLQKLYGGNGVGWMPLSSQTAGFRSSIQHKFNGWKDKSLISSQKHHSIIGHYYTGEAGAYAQFSLPPNTSPFETVQLYYEASEDTAIAFDTEEGTTEFLLTPSEHRLSNISFSSHGLSAVKLNLRTSGSTRFYGIALEGKLGISVDNLSLRGSSGMQLSSIDQELSRQFLLERQYDLIILQYGLNVANNRQNDYSNYSKTMIRVIELLRSLTPNTDFLIMGVSDRANKTGLGIETMPGILHLHKAQQEIAARTGSAFWSLYRAMRNRGGIAEMAKSNKAAKDYTHLTHKGGEDLAQDFISALNLEYQYYEAIK